jgi:hypothetical protein
MFHLNRKRAMKNKAKSTTPANTASIAKKAEIAKAVRKFVAKDDGFKLLGLGRHVVKILSVAEDSSKASDNYNDQTPQIVITFGNSKGTIRAWYNLMGYQKDENGEYIVDKDGNRVESDENTEAALSIFGRIAVHAGVPEGDEFDPMDLVDMELGINVVLNEQGKYRVNYTMPAENVEAAPVASTEIEG